MEENSAAVTARSFTDAQKLIIITKTIDRIICPKYFDTVKLIYHWHRINNSNLF